MTNPMFDLTHLYEYEPGHTDHFNVLHLVSEEHLLRHLDTIDPALHHQYYVTQWDEDGDIINHQPNAD